MQIPNTYLYVPSVSSNLIRDQLNNPQIWVAEKVVQQNIEAQLQ